MPRITYVKKAQQRYAMVAVIDPVTGLQKSTQKFGKNGEPKKTKSGREIIQRLTVADKTQPLPPLKCDKCHAEILVGQPYKHISPKSGPYGGRRLNRCGTCPDWQPWEYSSSLSARLAEVSHNFNEEFGEPDSAESVTEALSSAAESIREIAAEKRESAQNIEDGFGHSTSSSEELADIADQLDQWADEIDSTDVPDYPEPEEEPCDISAMAAARFRTMRATTPEPPSPARHATELGSSRRPSRATSRSKSGCKMSRTSAPSWTRLRYDPRTDPGRPVAPAST